MSTVVLAASVAGCGEANSGDAGASTEASVGSAEEEASSASEATTGQEAGTSEAGESGGYVDVPALGVSIIEVEANQGVRTPIGVDGVWVDGGGRNARMVRGRDTLIRVHHRLAADWVPRLIEARLEVRKPGSDPVVYTQRVEISEDSQERFLDRGFFFGLVAGNGETEPGVQYHVSLWETGPGGEGLVEEVNTTPSAGPAEIGFEGVQMEMNVVYVPFNYTAQGTTPDLEDPANQRVLEDLLYQQIPVTALNATFREPVVYSQNLQDLGQLLSAVSQVRSQDGAGPNVYYVGLIDTGAQSGVVGIAPLGGLYNANLWRTNKTSTAETVVHELGHNQSLPHVACEAADAAGPDPSYPDHPFGRILTTGFGVRSFQIFPGDSTFDYMSYCGPTWVSDFTWGKLWPRIEQMTALGSTAPQRLVLHHAVYDSDAPEEWWTSLEPFDAAAVSGQRHMDFISRDGESISVPARAEVLSDGRTTWVTAPVPANFSVTEFAEVLDAGGTNVARVSAGNIVDFRASAPH